ncbi:MAG: hypothetical protein V4486_01455 [Patescibacteria group bacterium]
MKKYLVLSLTVLVVVLGAAVVFAENNSTTISNAVTASGSLGVNPSPMMINIGPKGNVMLRGKVVSIDTSANSLVVKSWGGSWTIETTSSTNILSATKSISDFKADDVVGVIGSISKDGDFIITARILRAWGHKPDKDADGIPDDQDAPEGNDMMKQNREGHRGFMGIMPPRLDGMHGSRGGDDNSGSGSGSGDDN